MDVIQLPTSTEGATGATGATCAGCGAPLASDQRYCLACGRPCSPVRLAFLDVLQAEPQTTMPILGAPQATAVYAPPPDPPGLVGSLRRWSGVFGLLGVLLASLLIGLLVGHWLTGGSSSPGKQVLEVKGLSGLGAAAPAGSSAGAGGSSGGSGSSATHHGATGSGSSQAHSKSAGNSEGEVNESAAEEKQAVKEAQKAKPLPPAHKTSAAALKKLEHTTGKKHAEEVKAALGDEPIETH